MSTKLIILNFYGPRYEINVDEDDLIENIKIKIRNLGGPHLNSQRIIYMGKELNNNERIDHYIQNVFDKTNIRHMMLEEDKLTKFEVRLENGNILVIYYDVRKEGNSVESLKVHLFRILHIIISKMVLSIDGKILENDEKVTFLKGVMDLYTKKNI